MANVPTIARPEEIVVEVGPSNKLIYIMGVLNDIPHGINPINKNYLFKNGVLFEHRIELKAKMD
ncbi:21076_t:CDS:2 [Entrophospora sp. SA101]|nr:21076_t:CDS:2 [Entrophospora sp. SA101]